MWLLAGSQPHALHSLKRFFWRRPIVINHFGGKGASPALPFNAAVYTGAEVPSSPESAGLQDRSVNSVERRRRTKSALTHYKAGIPPNIDVIRKFNLPATERLKVLKLLDRSNINAVSLFQSEESLMETMAFRELDCHRL